MRLIYKPSDAGEDYPQPSEDESKLATNAWRLLKNWKLPPGMNGDVFTPSSFTDWLNAVKTQAKVDKRFEITMQEVGKVFYYYPVQEQGLWLPHEVAEILDGIDAEDIRTGYVLAIYNSLGAHWVDTEAKPEIELAEKWDSRADIANMEGYPRFSAALRGVAESYRRDAQRIIDEHAQRK